MPAPTDQQQRFVDHLVATGCTPTEAARHAGYAEPPQEAYRLIRKPHIQSAVRELRERMISTHAANVAMKTLVDVMQDLKAPASARVAAARTVWDAAGHFDSDAREGTRDKPLHEMSEAELTAFMARQEKIIADGGSAPVIIVAPQLAGCRPGLSGWHDSASSSPPAAVPASAIDAVAASSSRLGASI